MQLSDLKGGYKVVSAGGVTPPPIPPPNVQDGSTMAPQATFPATPTDNPLETGAKVVGNLPASAVGFAKSTFDFLNPLSTFDKVKKLAGALQDNKDNPSGAPSVTDVLKEVPGQAYKMVVPQFLQHIFAGDLSKASQTIVNDPIGQIAPLVLLARQGAEAAGKGSEFDAMISKVASPVTKSFSAVADNAKSVATGATRFLGGQLTGISPDTISKIVADPAQFSKEAESTVTRPALADKIASVIKDRQASLDETGSEYSHIRTDNTPIPVPQDYLNNLIKDTTGLSVDEGGSLHSSGSASIRNPSDISALQSKLYDVWKPEFDKGYLTPNEFLNFRADLARLANYDGGVGKSPALQNLSSVMRGKFNSDLRSNVPGLEKLDSSFAPEQTALTQLTRGLIDKDGNLSDSAINRIANATGKGKDPLLARLETLSPGITDHIKILKAVEDLQNSREVKTGTYLRAGALGAGIVTLNPYLIVSAIMSIPEVAVPLLRGVGYSTDTIGKVMNTLGIGKAASKAGAAVKSAVVNGGAGAPSAQNEPQPTP